MKHLHSRVVPTPHARRTRTRNRPLRKRPPGRSHRPAGSNPRDEGIREKIAPVRCAQCGTPFLKRIPTQRFCCRACYQEWWVVAVQPKAAARGFQRMVASHAGIGTDAKPHGISFASLGLNGTASPTDATSLAVDDEMDEETAWAARGAYWEQHAVPPMSGQVRRSHRTHPTPLVLTGHGVHLHVNHGALVTRDGFTHYPQAQRTWRFFPGEWRLPSRIVLVDTDGALSLDVLAWLAQQRIPLVMLDWRGEVISTTSGESGNPDSSLREAQVAAQRDGLGVQLAVTLIQEKVANSQRTLRVLPPTSGREWALRKLDRIQGELRRTPPEALAALRLVEARAALAYFTCWQALPMRWKGIGRHPIPPEWQRVGVRQSLLGGSNRNATHPVSAMLNYGYRVLESQVQAATVATGLDPTIGYLHACRPGRAALVYDLMEPLRPQVDRLVLDFVRSHTFAPSDVILTQTGACRLHPQLARTVAGMTVGEQPIQDVTAGALAALSRTATA
jgi:CRISPR-associated protein Cas1